MTAVLASPATASSKFSGFSTLAVCFAALLTIFCLVPFAPGYPDGALDGSWAHAMNVAVGKKLQFGRDIVFTFGPMASVYTRQYFPATDTFMLLGLSLIAVSVFLSFRVISGARNRLWLLALPFFLSQSILLDAIFIGMPLLALLASAKQVREPSYYRASVLSAAASMALLVIVKGSMIPTVAFCGVGVLLVAWRRSKPLAVCGIAIFVSVLLSSWVAGGQAISNLPTYFVAQGPIISGYTDAMSILGEGSEIAIYAACALLLLWAVWSLNCEYRRLALTATALFFFLCFKAGFVRHDLHAVTPAFALILVALLCFLWAPASKTAVLLALSVVSWGAITNSYSPVTASEVTARFAQKITSSVDGIAARIHGASSLRATLEQTNANIRAAHPLPAFKGTADIYPVAISVLLANGGDWAPRPVVQSYSAYTSELAQLNADHLRRSGPDGVYFSFFPIDGRYPALDDGASWPVLLNQYQVSQVDSEYALLERNTARPFFDLGPVAGEATGPLGTTIDVPALDSPVFVKIDLRPTLVGKLATIAFKSPQLHLVATYRDGHSKTYRYIASMGQSGFLLSPTISTVADFAALTSPNWKTYLEDQMPVKIGLYGDSGTRFAWQRTYDVKFFRLPVPSEEKVDRILFPTPKRIESIAGYQRAPECNVDTINSAAAITPYRTSAALLRIGGWAAVSATKGVANDAVSLAMVAPDGSATLHPVTKAERPDVTNAFGHQSLRMSGFEGVINLSQLTLPADLRIIQQHGSESFVCDLAVRVER